MEVNCKDIRVRVLLVSLGILCVLLAASVGVISWGGWKINQQEKLIADLRNETKHLNLITASLKKETKQLQTEREDLNRTMHFILTFDSFPVNEYCPNGSEYMILSALNIYGKCEPCQRDWNSFNGSCYLFEERNRSWNDSREYCQSKGADLVVVNNEEEQKFLSRQASSNYRYYWLGLRKIAGDWVWIDGRPDTL
ncbi:C-type lectin domain family 12 member B-like, partial [Cyprinodon tularosa]|uniref:C-type lectin domain family 12 member B-like n=1 Tax=Cyprinodon tularosa TaxID=77115 RepID=UPI0018E1E8C4